MRAWPELGEAGDLPVGIHPATLQEVAERFGVAHHRSVIARRLERIFHLAHTTGHVDRFIVFGSFVTAKPAPNDVDIFLLMKDSFDVRQVPHEARLVFDHASAQNVLGASVFWIRQSAALGDRDTAVAYWQMKRDGTRRGVVEIIDHG